jgi:CAAX prenyl protease-like protein
MTSTAQERAGFYRYLPFAVFMAFIGLDELLRFLAGKGLFTLTETTLYYLYPLKALVVGGLLYLYRHQYGELSLKELKNIPVTLAVCAVGMVVFVLWIHMDWTFAASGIPQGFNPRLLPEGGLQVAMTIFRIAGAVLVVPIMEELFWRSFLIRYVVDSDIEKVAIGTFTWLSFVVTVVLFGLEHHFILAGMMAGAVYNLILYKTRSLTQCVLAHAVTNLALAVYVISTGKWYYW